MAIQRFGEFELDTGLYQLRRGDDPVEIGARVFDVLAYLIRNRDRMVSKDELIRQVWGVTAMSGSSVPTCIAAVRKALNDDPAEPQYIETQRGRGYRFIASVSLISGGVETQPSETDASVSLRDMQNPGFVGRDNEMAALYAAFERTLSGTPQLVLVTGEPGIGKTRIIEEFALAARDDGAVVLIGRCIEGEGAPAFWPWVQIVRSHIEALDASNVLAALGPLGSSLVSMIPELGERHPEIPAPPEMDADQARFRLLDAIASMLARAAAERPLVVLLDDLHRADASSILLLQFATREIRDSHVLFIGTYRDTELLADTTRARALADLVREKSSRCIQLHGLTLDGVESFVAQALARGNPAQPLVTALYDQTGGNPFFLTQIVHLLSAEGELDQLDPSALRRIDLPGGVREAVGRQLDGLPLATREMLNVAAVAGREFETSALAAASSRSSDAVLSALEPALASHLLTAVPGQVGSYRFAHMILRDHVYDALAPTERVRLHCQIGEAIERLHATHLDARTAELAHHFHEAILALGSQRAISYSLAAAKWANSRLAYENVPEHYRRALRLLDQEPEADPIAIGNLLLTLGESELRAGERDEAQETFKRAVQIARDQNAPELLANAALGLAPGFFAIEVGVFDPLLVSLLEEALETVPASKSPLRAMLLARLCHALAWSDRPDQRIHLGIQSLEMAREIDDPKSIATALLAQYSCLCAPNERQKRQLVLTEIENLAARLKDPEMILMHKLLHITESLESGNLATVYRQVASFRQIAIDQGRPGLVWYSELFQSMLAILQGRFDSAKQLSSRFRGTGDRARDRNALHAHAAQLAILNFEAGTSNTIIGGVRALVYDHPNVNGWRCTLAYLLAETGATSDAQRELDILAARHFSDYAHRQTDNIALNLLAGTAARLGDVRSAECLYSILKQAEGSNTVIAYAVAYFGPVDDRLGQLASTLGDSDTANSHFLRAIENCRKIGSEPWLARTQFHQAEHLQRSRIDADRTNAIALAVGSAEIAARLNMCHLSSQIRILLSRLRGSNETLPGNS